MHNLDGTIVFTNMVCEPYIAYFFNLRLSYTGRISINLKQILLASNNIYFLTIFQLRKYLNSQIAL